MMNQVTDVCPHHDSARSCEEHAIAVLQRPKYLELDISGGCECLPRLLDIRVEHRQQRLGRFETVSWSTGKIELRVSGRVGYPPGHPRDELCEMS
jgi:hypothetical protein